VTWFIASVPRKREIWGVSEPIELPRIGWVTLAVAATRLGTTPWGARRWIREGRLHAEMRRGPQGSHYFVPVHQVEALAAQLGLPMAVGAEALPLYGDPGELDDAALVKVLLDLRAQVHQAVETRAESEAALREELNQIRAELAAGIEALKLARVNVEEPPTPNRRWWRFWR